MINRTTLNELSMEAIELLKDRPISAPALNILRWMNPARQVEAAELMVSTGNFSRNFAQALLVATKPEGRITSGSRPIPGLSEEQKVRMQQELECVLNDFRATEIYGADVLSLVVASGYVSKLIGNKAIESYLGQNHPEILQEFRTVVATGSLDEFVRQARLTKCTSGGSRLQSNV